jgi:hypothetical protein
VIDGTLVLVALIGLGAVALLVARSPRFWKKVGQEVATAMLPKFLRPFRPKNFTKDELNKVSKGIDPFSDQK